MAAQLNEQSDGSMDIDPERARQTPHGQAAIAFANELTRSNFKAAHSMLMADLRNAISPADLKTSYEKMIAYADNASVPKVDVIVAVEDWPTKQPTDVGWAYASIDGTDDEGSIWCEAVSVVVANEAGQLRIRDIKWGRP